MKIESATVETVTAPRRLGLLEEPTFGWGEIAPRKPTLREIFVEWIDSINFLKKRTRFLTAAFTAFHLFTFGVFIYFFVNYFSGWSVGGVMGISAFIATVYNTVWYHR